MGIVRKEVFVDLLMKSPPLTDPVHTLRGADAIRQQLVQCAGINVIDMLIPIDREAALRVYAQVGKYVETRGFLVGKLLRPWELDKDIYEDLDRKEPWWGFEFETGWDSAVHRSNAIRYVWDTWDNVAFDPEGEAWAVEITFAPQEMSKYLDKTAQAYQFAKYLATNPHVHYTDADDIGTHINISHPLMRGDVNDIRDSMNRTVAHLPLIVGDKNVRQEFFGRQHVYGGFFNGVGDVPWLEGKLFRTTYDINVFDTYVTVCKALTKALTALLENGDLGKTEERPIPFVTNLYEMVVEEAEPQIAFSRLVRSVYAGMGVLINGQLARDSHNEFATSPHPLCEIAYPEDDFYEDYDEDCDEEEDY